MRWITLIVAFVSILSIDRMPPAPTNPGLKRRQLLDYLQKLPASIRALENDYWSGFV